MQTDSQLDSRSEILPDHIMQSPGLSRLPSWLRKHCISQVNYDQSIVAFTPPEAYNEVQGEVLIAWLIAREFSAAGGYEASEI